MVEELDMLRHVLAPASHFMAEDLMLDLAPLIKHVRNRGTVFFFLGESGRMMWEEVRNTIL